MSDFTQDDVGYVAPAEVEDQELYHPKSWITKYVFCQDAKVIAIQYSFTAIAIGLVGLVLSWMMRLQLGFPDSFSFIEPSDYYQFITAHGMIMVIYLLTALFLGGFGNYLIPLMVGARDMAFPYVNMVSYWVYLGAVLLLVASFFVPGGPTGAGWTLYPPQAILPTTPGSDGGIILMLVSLALFIVGFTMGVLNYVISSAQLHRWHHSIDIEESGTNYGNNLIIWDLLFGSWFLPKDRQVGELGLINRSYPMSFSKQMKTPFTPGIDKYQTLMLSFKEVLQNLQVQLGLVLALFVYRIPFGLSLSNPMKYQHKVLKRIMWRNKDTQYGRLHKFDEINNQQDYSRNIPVQNYEDLRSYIEEQEATKQPCLTKEQPHYYAVTSGTTGEPKYIPVLPVSVKQHQRALAIFACVQNQTRRHAFGGKLLAIPGAYNEGKLQGGSIYGSISGLLYFLMPRYLQEKYTVPNEVFALHDHELKYRLIIRLAIQHANISYMVSANPSTFLKLIGIINDEIETFADDIGTEIGRASCRERV